jgi:ring-1,2-phenylacetyl-CoA epoxidase subunit PaaE
MPVDTPARLEFHPLRVCQVRPETDEVVSVAFEVPPHLAELYRFQPGQHLTLRRTFGDEEVRRSYSICSGVDDGELRVAVKRVPGGRFSQWIHQEVRAGACLDVMTPAGRFTTQLDPARQRHYLALAVGKGITPIMALLKSCLGREPRSRFTLVYGNRTSRSILFRDQLADLKDRYLDRFQLVHVLSGQHQEVPLFNGRVDAERLRLLAGTLLDLQSVDEVFICCPQPTAQALREALRDLGIAHDRVHFELFGTPHVVERTPAAPGECHLAVIARGIRTEVDLDAETTVLEAGLAAGLDLPFSCRDGVCATCRAHLTEGKVHMAANYALEPWELERGFILTCQSRPVSPHLVVDYDHT